MWQRRSLRRTFRVHIRFGNFFFLVCFSTFGLDEQLSVRAVANAMRTILSVYLFFWFSNQKTLTDQKQNEIRNSAETAFFSFVLFWFVFSVFLYTECCCVAISLYMIWCQCECSVFHLCNDNNYKTIRTQRYLLHGRWTHSTQFHRIHSAFNRIKRSSSLSSIRTVLPSTFVQLTQLIYRWHGKLTTAFKGLFFFSPSFTCLVFAIVRSAFAIGELSFL